MDPYLYTISELQKFLIDRGLEIKGTKTALIDRLIDNDPQCFQILPPPSKANTKTHQLLDNRQEVTALETDKAGTAGIFIVNPCPPSTLISADNMQKDDSKREPLQPMDRNDLRCRMNNSRNLRHDYNES